MRQISFPAWEKTSRSLCSLAQWRTLFFRGSQLCLCLPFLFARSLGSELWDSSALFWVLLDSGECVSAFHCPLPPTYLPSPTLFSGFSVCLHWSQPLPVTQEAAANTWSFKCSWKMLPGKPPLPRGSSCAGKTKANPGADPLGNHQTGPNTPLAVPGRREDAGHHLQGYCWATRQRVVTGS